MRLAPSGLVPCGWRTAGFLHGATTCGNVPGERGVASRGDFLLAGEEHRATTEDAGHGIPGACHKNRAGYSKVNTQLGINGLQARNANLGIWL